MERTLGTRWAIFIGQVSRFILFLTQDPAPNSNADSKASGEDLGEVIADLDDVTFFLAACYRGRADLSYLCLQSGKASVLHTPHAQRDAHVTLESAFCGAELQSTLYPTEAGARQGLEETDEPMLALAMKVSMDTDKNVKVSEAQRLFHVNEDVSAFSILFKLALRIIKMTAAFP